MTDFIRKSANPQVEDKEDMVLTSAPTENIAPVNSFVMVKNYRGGFGVALEP